MSSRESWRFCAPACALALVALAGCGPRQGGGGSEGGAGAEASGGSGPDAAGEAGTSGTGGATAGGAAGIGAVAGAGAGAGGAADEDAGYDGVVGCAAVAWPEVATFTLIGSMSDRFFPNALSGDGQVVGGAHDSVPVRWRADTGFAPIPGIDGAPIQLSCQGDVAVARAFSSGIYRESSSDGLEYLFGNANDPAYPVSLSPDGSVIVGNLDESYAGPFPVRWTRDAGAELIEELANSLVYSTSPDGVSLLGADILHIFRWQAGAGKSALLLHAPLAFDGPPTMPVSADGKVFAFSPRTTLDAMMVARSLDEQPQLVECPYAPCAPIDLSGTGKVVLMWGDSPDARGTRIWTAEHGFRNLGDLIREFGGDTQGRVVSASYISDDGQAFAGLATDPNNPLDYQGFYATLPAAAYP